MSLSAYNAAHACFKKICFLKRQGNVGSYHRERHYEAIYSILRQGITCFLWVFNEYHKQRWFYHELK